jgi:outer membrane protein TolC
MLEIKNSFLVKRILVANLTVFALFSAYAQQQPLKTFSLKDAEEYALQNKSEAKNAQLGIDEAKARNWEIIATGLPVVSGSADYTYYFKRPESPAIQKIFGAQTEGTLKLYQGFINAIDLAGATTPAELAVRNGLVEAKKGVENSKTGPISFVLPHSLQAGVQVSELLFDGRYMVGLKATKDFMKAALLSKNVSDQDIRYSVRKAYYQAQAAQQAIRLLHDNELVLEKLVSDNREVYKAGFIEELDVNRLDLILINLKSQIQTQEQLAEVALANLKFQMGLSVSDQIVLTDKLETLREKIGPAALTFNPNQRPEYDLLQTAMRIKGHDTKQRAAGYMPTLAAFLSYGGGSQTDKFVDIFKKDPTTGKNNWFQQGLVGLTLKVPIFDSGQRNAQVKQGKIAEAKAKNDFENFLKGVELQLQVSQTNFNASLREELNAKRSLELSEKIYNKSRVKFKEGVGSSFELAQAEQEFITNQLKKINNTLSVLTTKADLDKAQGIK